MNRRSFLVTSGAVLIAGCSADTLEEENANTLSPGEFYAHGYEFEETARFEYELETTGGDTVNVHIMNYEELQRWEESGGENGLMAASHNSESMVSDDVELSPGEYYLVAVNDNEESVSYEMEVYAEEA